MPGKSGYGAGAAGAPNPEFLHPPGNFGGTGGASRFEGEVTGAGGGGGGLGGAVFVRQSYNGRSASFVPTDCNFVDCQAIAGLAGVGSSTLGASNGAGLGGDLFFSQSLTLECTTECVAPGGISADRSEVGGSGLVLEKTGAGRLSIYGPVDLPEGTLLVRAGILRLTSFAGVGGPGNALTLQAGTTLDTSVYLEGHARSPG